MKSGCVFLLGLLALWQGVGAYVVRSPYLTAARRAVPAEGGDASPQLISSNPISPFLALRPFLPSKPTIVPPFVDPSTFIDQKTALLNSLFPPSVSGDAATAPNPGTASPIVNPTLFTSKKTEFLNALFSGLSAKSSEPVASQTVKRDLSESSEVPEDSPSSTEPDVVANPFVDKKSAFLDKLFKILNVTAPAAEESPVTAKPTIVPPSFWLPVSAADSPVTPKPTIVPANFWVPSPDSVSSTPSKTPPPILGPKVFLDKKTKFLNTLFSSLAIPPKPAVIPPTDAPVVPAAATVYQQKVSDFLDKLFDSLNLTSNPVNVSTRSVLKRDKTANVRRAIPVRRFIGPPLGIWGPSFIPAMSPKLFIDKKTEFLGKLFTSLNTPAPSTEEASLDEEPAAVKPTIVPPNFWSPFASGTVDAADSTPTVKPIAPPSFWSPSASGSVDAADSSTTVKPTIVPPSFWSPFAGSSAVDSAPDSPVANPAPVVDPSAFISKKTEFLDTLFSSLNTPTTTEAPAVALEDDANDADDTELANLLSSILQSEEPAGDLSKRHIHDSSEISDEELSDDVSKRALDGSVTPANPLFVAKDKVVNSILTELGGIKDEMMSTVDEIIKQKQVVSTSAAASNPYSEFGGSSPSAVGGGKPFGAPKKIGAPLGKKAAKTAPADSKTKASPKFSAWQPTPAPDPTLPLQQRLEFLNQVFEMLTKLQQDVSSAVDEATGENTPTTQGPPTDEDDVLNLVKQIVTASNSSKDVKRNLLRSISAREIQPGSDAPSSHPNQLTPNSAAEDARRSIKMAVHQGYQSLPPGTEETIETGGGSETDEHEGGGLKLQIKVPI